MRTALVLTGLTAVLALATGVAPHGRPAPTPQDSAEGFWIAAMPSGVNVKWAILDGGDTWGIYESEGTVLGAFHGQTRSANGALLGNGLAYDIPSGTVGSTSFSGAYIARQTLSLTTEFGMTIHARYVPAYETPANPAVLAGRYSGEGLSSHRPVIGMQLQVADDGRFVMTSSGHCAASGSARPRPGGKNIFNVSMHFSGAGCPLGDGVSAEGIAHVGAESGELFMLALNAARTDGWLFLAQRHSD